MTTPVAAALDGTAPLNARKEGYAARSMSIAPVLLVHGFASSFEDNWRQPGWIDLLGEAGRTVIPFDLLGHGTAAKPHDPEAYGDLSGQILAAMPDVPVDAIGFSLGSHLLLELASKHPERLNRLVVGGVGTNVMTEHGNVETTARAVETGAPGDDDPPVARALAQLAAGAKNDRAALAACLRRRSTALTAEQLGHITCPVLVVLGDRDFVGPADPLMAALPNAELLTLRGTDHFGTPKDFRFIEAALRFLDAVPA
jgi:pimeloyl-ACP methyl ester carboxylesterase